MKLKKRNEVASCVILHSSASRSTNGGISSEDSCQQLCDRFNGDIKMCLYEWELIETYNEDNSSSNNTIPETWNTSSSQRCEVFNRPNSNFIGFGDSFIQSENACLELCDSQSSNKYQCVEDVLILHDITSGKTKYSQIMVLHKQETTSTYDLIEAVV